MSSSSVNGTGPPPVVVVGASAGGVESLRDFVSWLPADLGVSVLVVLHVPAASPSALPAILRRTSNLPVRQAQDGERLSAGEILIARPDHHLVVVDGSVLLTRGPRENGHRPAVDVLFRSAARARGPRAMAVVLSGALDDGASGSVAIASRGGVVAVQDFDEALYASMPRAAALAVERAEQRTARGLAELVASWVDSLPDDTPNDQHADRSELEKEVDVARMEPEAMHDLERPGSPSGFGCPDCAGALYQIEEGNTVRYRCRVGHAWSSESLVARKTVDVEGALWVALRSLEEKAALNTELGERAGGLGHDRTALRFAEGAKEATHAAELVRRLITEIGDAVAAHDDAGQTAIG